MDNFYNTKQAFEDIYSELMKEQENREEVEYTLRCVVIDIKKQVKLFDEYFTGQIKYDCEDNKFRLMGDKFKRLDCIRSQLQRVKRNIPVRYPKGYCIIWNDVLKHLTKIICLIQFHDGTNRSFPPSLKSVAEFLGAEISDRSNFRLMNWVYMDGLVHTCFHLLKFVEFRLQNDSGYGEVSVNLASDVTQYVYRTYHQIKSIKNDSQEGDPRFKKRLIFFKKLIRRANYINYELTLHKQLFFGKHKRNFLMKISIRAFGFCGALRGCTL